MDGWDRKKGEVYKEKGVDRKRDLKHKYLKKREVLNKDKKNIERGEWIVKLFV